jgi:hypothetical protein
MINDKRDLRTTLATLRERDGGKMTPEQFKDAIAKVGLSQQGAGEYFGKYKRIGQAWALGEKPVPVAVQRCLEFMIEHKLKAKDFES